MLRITVKPGASAAKGGINALPHAVLPPAPATGIWLKLAPGLELKASLQRRVGFKQYFNGVLLDWSYLSVRTIEAVQADAAWLQSQRLHCGVDLSNAIDLFPGLRLGNFTSDCPRGIRCSDGEFYNRSLAAIRDILWKCGVMQGGVCRDMFMTLHGMPEIGPEAVQVKEQVAATVKMLVTEAATYPVTLHLRHCRKNTAIAGESVSQQASWAKGVGLQLAVNSGLAALDGVALAGAGVLSSRSFLLLDGVSELFASRRVGSQTPPLLGTQPQLLQAIMTSIRAALAANASLVLDAGYSSLLLEEGDTVWLGQVLRSQLPPSPPSPPSPPVPPGPRPPSSHCYKLDTAEVGICSVESRQQKIVMGCPPGPGSHCYADYMRANFTWAGDYGTHFDGALTSANAAQATTRLTERGGQWTITVSLQSKVHTWTSPSGYMPLLGVTSVTCGAPKGPQSLFDCAD